MTTPATRQFKLYIRTGDPAVLGKLYDLAAPQLLSLALHLTQQPAQAEDLVQEVFLRAIQRREQWDSSASVEQWMTEDLAVQFERSLEASDKRAQLATLADPHVQSPPDDPALEAQRVELAATLDSALAELPDAYRTVVRLLVQDGLSSEEVGEALERPAGTVRSQLSRGLNRLRTILPATLGLGLWVASKDMGGIQATAEETLESLKLRFFENCPVASRPLAQTSSTVPWLWAATAAGVGLLTLAAMNWNSAETVEARSADTPLTLLSQTASAQEAQELALRLPSADAGRQLAEVAPAPTRANPVRISGQVLGKAGEAIPGAEVSIYYWEPWSDELKDHKLDKVRGYGWSTLSDSNGDYSIDLPCLPPGSPALHVATQGGHTEETLWFASGKSHVQPIRMGENRMPVVQLVPAGAIEGRLLRHDGSPAYPASVKIYPGKDHNVKVGYSTETDGSFGIAGLPAGTHTLRFSLGGSVQQSTILVRAGSTTTSGTTVFKEPTSLLVHVTDMQGRDFSGAFVKFIPLINSQTTYYAPKKTDAAGLLEVLVPSLDQHRIDVLADGFRTEQGLYHMVAGQETLEVRMKAVTMTQVRAIDKQTGLPMPRFELSVELRHGAGWTQLGRTNYSSVTDGGTKSIAYLAEGRCRIYRLGFQAAYFDFQEGLPDIVEVQLSRTNPVSGRVLFAGAPVAGSPVEICIRNSPGLIDPSPQELRSKIHQESEEVLWAETDSVGNFSFEPMADAGLWYCLRVQDRQHNGIEHWFQVDEGNPPGQDLGDLELSATGTLRGKVLVPEGINPMGLAFLADFRTGAMTTIAGPTGTFELENIVPGEHILRLQTDSGFASLERQFTFTIKAGEILERTIDLRPLALCLRHLHITDQGQPIANHKVFLSVDEPSTQAAWDACLMGYTDSNGHITGEVPTKGQASLWVQSQAGETPRRHPTASVPLTSKSLPAIEVAY